MKMEKICKKGRNLTKDLYPEYTNNSFKSIRKKSENTIQKRKK